MQVVADMLPYPDARWTFRCPACGARYAVALPPEALPHRRYGCRCGAVVWAVRWWRRVEVINQWRTAPARVPGDRPAAVLAMLACAAAHLRSLPAPERHELQLRRVERAFGDRDTQRGLDLLGAFAPDLLTAATAEPAASDAADPPSDASAATERPAGLPAGATAAKPAGKAQIVCPHCREWCDRPANAYTVDGVVVTCRCGHRWVWSLQREMDAIRDRLAVMQAQADEMRDTLAGLHREVAPVGNLLLKLSLGQNGIPLSPLTRRFAEAAADSPDLDVQTLAMQLVSIERGTPD